MGSYVKNSDAFKSKAEVEIARFFDRHQISYRYEHPLAVVDHGKLRIWYPDFYLPGYGLIAEYFGRLDDPDYVRGMRHKMDVYQEQGIDGIYLTEESFRGDWPRRILGQIEQVLAQRLDRFCRRTSVHGHEPVGHGGDSLGKKYHR